MKRLAVRALVVLALAAVLAMHGVDATSAAAHGESGVGAMADGQAHVPTAAVAGADAGGHRHDGVVHVAMACVAMLLVVTTTVARRRFLRGLRSHVASMVEAASGFIPTASALTGRPPPSPTALCISRC